MEAEIGMMWLQARECQQPLETRRGKECYHGLNVHAPAPPPNSYFEALTLKVVVVRGRAFRSLSSDEVTRVVPSRWAQYPCKGKDTRARSLSRLEERPCEGLSREKAAVHRPGRGFAPLTEPIISAP